MEAAPTACGLLTVVELLKDMNEPQPREVPDNVLTPFVRKHRS